MRYGIPYNYPQQLTLFPMRLGLWELGGKSRRSAGFFVSGRRTVPLRTRIYIDGFNLYYGCLRQTPYKWLDLIKLFEQHILPTALHRPDTDANASSMVLDECAIRYFTAPILGSAAKGADSVASQSQYHAALLSSKRISLTKGY